MTTPGLPGSVGPIECETMTNTAVDLAACHHDCYLSVQNSTTAGNYFYAAYNYIHKKGRS